MGKSKIIYGGQVLIDLTSDTIKAEKLLSGYTAHGADGEIITGVCDYDANTQDATATESEILVGKSAYNKGSKINGAMPNNGAVGGIISVKNGSYIIPHGYHDGSGTVVIDQNEQAKLIPSNIKQGVTILGVTGMHEGAASVKVQQKIVTPSTAEQTILPDEDYDYLVQVIVSAIPYVESENTAGGITVMIG